MSNLKKIGGYRLRTTTPEIFAESRPRRPKGKPFVAKGPKEAAKPPEPEFLKHIIWCLRCTTKRINRPRGLCWGCYYKPGVKELYPSTSKYSRRGVGNFSGASKPAASPTEHEPGSPGKMLVMETRAKAGQSLFHPGDAGGSDPLILELARAA